jgi:hypothetical protein
MTKENQNGVIQKQVENLKVDTVEGKLKKKRKNCMF